MSRTIGPLPLLAGLQTQAAEGSPTGLFRALNVEPRDGLVQTRRGTSPVATFSQNGGTASLDFGVVHPAAWGGQTTVFIGVTSGDFAPDTILPLSLTSGSLATIEVDETITYEFFGDDDAWHPLEVANTAELLAGYYFANTTGLAADDSVLHFVVPHGWKTAQPTGTPSSAKWIRLTRATAWPVGVSPTVFYATTTPATTGFSPLVLCPTTRGGNGPYVATLVEIAPHLWEVFDMGRSPEGHPRNYRMDTEGYIGGMNDDEGLPLYDGSPAVGVYVSASDKLLLSLGRKLYVIDCGKAPGEDGACLAFRPIVDVDGPYGDINCEEALNGGPSAMAVFGGRVFMGGFPDAPQQLQWSAPGEFWETWPSANRATLGSGSSGRILAMVPMDEQLWIFTTAGIWRAALGDPTAGNESDLFIDLVEETPCASAKSVVAAGPHALFLSDDGVRAFNGQRSKLISEGVRDLFRGDSAHPLACLRKHTSVAVWHPGENQYRLAYSSPACAHNDVALIVDIDDKSAWLWGADQVSGADSDLVTQRSRGLRASAWAWDGASSSIVGVDPTGTVFFRCDVGDKDFGVPIRWHLESQTLRIAAAERSVLERVDLTVMREHFEAFVVKAIPDGNMARADSRTIAAQRDGLTTASVLGTASLAGNITMAQTEASFAPVTARFRKAGRNHRVRLESTGAHAALKLFSLTAVISGDKEAR